MSTVVRKIRSIFRKSQNQFVPETQSRMSKASTLLSAGHFLLALGKVSRKQNATDRPWGVHLTLGLNSHRKVATAQGGISLTNTVHVSMSGPHAYKREGRPTNLRHSLT